MGRPLPGKGSDSRNLPLLVLDYAFIRNKDEDDLTTILVGKCYPSPKVSACVLDAKGTDQLAINKVADLIRDCGLTRFVWKSDQERAIRALMEEAIKRSVRFGSMLPADVPALSAVPAASPVGLSTSNGRAERTVQMVEDRIRTLNAALEAHIGAVVLCDGPVTRWLVQHAASLHTRTFSARNLKSDG